MLLGLIHSVELLGRVRGWFKKAGSLSILEISWMQKPCHKASKELHCQVKEANTQLESETMCIRNYQAVLWHGTEKVNLKQFVSQNTWSIPELLTSSNILKEVMKELAVTAFPSNMQLDDSIDLSQCSQLPVFIHYVHVDATMEFLCCESLLETMKAIDIFERMNKLFAKQNFNLVLCAQMVHLWFLATRLVLLRRWRKQLYMAPWLITFNISMRWCQRFCQQSWKKSCLLLWKLSAELGPWITIFFFLKKCQK